VHAARGVARAEPPPLDASAAAALLLPAADETPRASAKWRRVALEDGDSFWHHPATDVSAYELPPGAATACGWRHRQGKGLWAHGESGATSPRPPPADAGEAEAIIAAHRAAMAAAAAGHGAPPPAPANSARFAPADGAPPRGAPAAPPSAVAALLERRTPRASAATTSRHREGGRGASELSHRGAARVLSKAEALAASRSAVVKARAARAFEGGGPMTPFFAAMLVQLRWRQLRANRTQRLWKNVAALDGGGGKMEAGGSHQADVPLGGGWVQRFSRITGDGFYFHKESGRSQWELPLRAIAPP
jgi:hypothetical protein